MITPQINSRYKENQNKNSYIDHPLYNQTINRTWEEEEESPTFLPFCNDSLSAKINTLERLSSLRVLQLFS